MTTRLSQRKVKAGSPAYEHLLEEMSARILGSGADYVIPLGGIPRTDMTLDIQEALSTAESPNLYMKPEDGITKADLALSVRESLALADKSYHKPDDGIPLSDLSKFLQEKIDDIGSAYMYPRTGIPYVDLDSNLKRLIQEALGRYILQPGGIPFNDLEEEVQDILTESLSKYIKPDKGIPLTDLEVEVLKKAVFDEYIRTQSKHENLDGVGIMTHNEIDVAIDEHSTIITDLSDEVEFARGEYSTIGRRLDSEFFERHDVLIKDTDFSRGTMENLMLSRDKILHFIYNPEDIKVEYYDMSMSSGYEQGNKMREESLSVIEKNWPDEIFIREGVSYAKNVGVLIEGFIYAPKTGEYNFGVQASGEYTFTVNETSGNFSLSSLTALDDDHVSNPLSVLLTGGQFYRLSLIGINKIEKDSMLRIVWRPPGEKTYTPVERTYFSNIGYNTETIGVYTTEAIDTDKLSVRKISWAIETDHPTPSSYIELEWRTSANGIDFSEWNAYQFDEEIEDGIERYVQARLTFTRGATNTSPVLKEIRLDYLSNKNNLYHEWQDARRGYPSLRSHMDSIIDRVSGIEELATSIDHSMIDTRWLQNVRFEHLDINMMRMHWEQLKSIRTSAHIMPSGFVDDFHDLRLVDEGIHSARVENSKLYPVLNDIEFNSGSDWIAWERLNTSPSGDNLALTYLGSAGVAAYYTEGEAKIERDMGQVTNFFSSDVSLVLSGGTIEIKYSSSLDGKEYSEAKDIISEIPNGRYLKIWIRIIRGSVASSTPYVSSIKIWHNPEEVLFQTKPVGVTRIPTHAIIDVSSSNRVGMMYSVSRDGGFTFKDIIPGIQTDLRDIGVGRDMVVRVNVDQYKQDDDVWIDYLGLQTITHEDYNDKSVIVSHHQVEMAEHKQTIFRVNKPFLMGDNSLQVYVNGVYQISGISYAEKNNTTIVMNNELIEGDYVVFRIATAAYEFEDAAGLEGLLIETKEKLVEVESSMAGLSSSSTTLSEELVEIKTMLIEIRNDMGIMSEEIAAIKQASATTGGE